MNKQQLIINKYKYSLTKNNKKITTVKIGKQALL
jgi:hypothetical protein